MKRGIYLDNHSTTPMDPRVFEAMRPYFCERFGNAASRTHAWGWEAEEAVERARDQVARGIGASPKEIVFTSGATEADNLAIKGVAAAYRERGRHLVTVVTEHKAVLDPCTSLEREGWSITRLGVGEDGVVTPAALEAALRPDTVLVSVMHANNEVGVVAPIAALAALCRARGVLFHTDAAQSVGRIPFDVDALGVDLASLSAHKLYGPKGIGALYVRRKPRVRLVPLLDGGGHERGMRSGTLPVPLIVAFGAAVELAVAERDVEATRLLALRERLLSGLTQRVPFLRLNGHPTERLPGNLNVSVAYVEGESLMMGLDDIAVSSGSACTSESLEPSYVLKALGLRDDLAHSAIRFGIGRFNTESEIDAAIEKVAQVVGRLRELSPLWDLARAGLDPDAVEWTPAS